MREWQLRVSRSKDSNDPACAETQEYRTMIINDNVTISHFSSQCWDQLWSIAEQTRLPRVKRETMLLESQTLEVHKAGTSFNASHHLRPGRRRSTKMQPPDVLAGRGDVPHPGCPGRSRCRPPIPSRIDLCWITRMVRADSAEGPLFLIPVGSHG